MLEFQVDVSVLSWYKMGKRWDFPCVIGSVFVLRKRLDFSGFGWAGVALVNGKRKDVSKCFSRNRYAFDPILRLVSFSI